MEDANPNNDTPIQIYRSEITERSEELVPPSHQEKEEMQRTLVDALAVKT
jgi:hypothetical protein